jgi:hypothetical protein
METYNVDFKCRKRGALGTFSEFVRVEVEASGVEDAKDKAFNVLKEGNEWEPYTAWVFPQSSLVK